MRREGQGEIFWRKRWSDSEKFSDRDELQGLGLIDREWNRVGSNRTEL